MKQHPVERAEFKCEIKEIEAKMKLVLIKELEERLEDKCEVLY